MKQFFRLILAGLAAAGLFAACTPPFEPDLSESYNLQSEKSSTDLSIRVVGESLGNTYYVQPPAGSPEHGYPERFRVQVNSDSGTINFDIGPDKKIKGLSIFPLKAGTDNYTLYEEIGPGLAYTAQPVAKNKVELALPFNEPELQPGSTPTSYLLLKLDPTQVTFNGGRGKLNTDGDTLPGEAEEDAYYAYFTAVQPKTGPSYAAPSLGRRYNDNTEVVTPGTPYPALPGNDFLNYGGAAFELRGFRVPSTVSATPYAHFTAGKLIQAYRFEKFNRVTGTWAPLPIDSSSSFDTTNGALTIRFAAAGAPGAFDIVRYMVDPYKITADIKAGGSRGTTLRSDYKQFLNSGTGGIITDTDWTYSNVMDSQTTPNPWLTIFDATALDVTPNNLAVSGGYRSYYLELELRANYSGVVNPGTTLADLESLRQAASAGTAQSGARQSNIRIFQVNGTGAPSTDTGKIIKEINFDRSRIELTSPVKFRIYLPADYVNYSSGAYLEVHIINAKATFMSGAESKTATFFKPNGALDYTGAYRFRVKGPAY
jgi:hypothetical protein